MYRINSMAVKIRVRIQHLMCCLRVSQKQKQEKTCCCACHDGSFWEALLADPAFESFVKHLRITLEESPDSSRQSLKDITDSEGSS